MRNVGKLMIAVATATSLAACANSEQASTVDPGSGRSSATIKPLPSTTSSTPQPNGGDVSTAVECTAADFKIDGAANSKPKITLPANCSPPKAILSEDLIAGTGPEVKAGATLVTHYVLVTWSDRAEKDTSWGGNPFPLENVGQAGVIDGWNEGLIGMKQGGRRLLVVPPDKGYGPGGNGIAPNETLVFVVDAVQVT
ncbi:FKBP-type peptidyl-prolyl cis-trans isomerase [Actinokineospora iranica]|uniref:Peptidyl-prolyl cis-trans isomerase n=1 Tax=Actinokineospora iranica TaxID=1271860 RepID=A0A1G6J943_9PSEU|nr:FKBP-type peptidyl-prolyl cis-trans isomerase [Actinokineospora iranica]SDC15211.1 peptidylprolyl isomerase [Actinokineospora iranica]